MCLNLEREPIKAKVATRNIPVWKILTKVGIYSQPKSRYIRTENLQTPYQKVRVKLGELMKSDMDKSTTKDYITRGIHSYAKPQKWDRYSKCYPAFIPKGTLYYVGTHNKKISYASAKLQILDPKDRRYKARMARQSK